MYLTGTTSHLKQSEAIKLASRIRPEGGKCILRRDPLGKLDLIRLSPKQIYPGQSEFVERRSDIVA
jgi:hypothetical protein